MKKKVFVFDWDGTLFDSMNAKTGSFAAVMHDWLTAQNAALPQSEVARLYRIYSGAPRREIFRKIARDAGASVSSADCEAMSQTLFARNRVLLEDAHLFDDALPCLETLLAHDKTVCLSSSVPQAELSHFVDRKLPDSIRGRLAEVLGSQPDLAKGPGHAGRIRDVTGTAPGDIIIIGDDITDCELSHQAGIDSILVDRDGHLPPHTPHISSLNEITGQL